MSKVILVTGGARSGKSTIAERLLLKKNENILYLATSVAFDEEMKDRIGKHQSRRDKRWKLAEIYENFKLLSENIDFIHSKNILLDCITVMISNRFFESNFDNETSLEEYENLEKEILSDVGELISLSKRNDKTLVIVTNELGMGIVPIDRYTRMYRDMAGRINQFISSEADSVILAVSGIGIDIKKLEINY